MFKKKHDFGFIVGVKEEYNALKNTKYDFFINFNIDNVLADEFYDNIRTNAWGGRYFEPAYGRYFLLGIELWY